MRRFLCAFVSSVSLFLASCDVHEWPEMPVKVNFVINLEYQTEMTIWEFSYEDGRLTEQGTGISYDNRLDSGRIRHIVRAYPLSAGQRYAGSYSDEYIFISDISDGYDCELEIALQAGDYRIMVWSDLIQSVEDAYFYNAGNFSEITLQGAYRGDTDYRDAFRGVGDISLAASIVDQVPESLEISMQRPLAKYEFISTDLQDFSATDVSLDKCIGQFVYAGFVPCSYDMVSDSPNDAFCGMSFESAPEPLSFDMASLGFDYVFVNGKPSAVDVCVGLYDADGHQVAMTGYIQVPLKRNRHTVIKGPFLMMQASGGIRINPIFDGNYNIVIE